jgi:hypothetical protein
MMDLASLETLIRELPRKQLIEINLKALAAGREALAAAKAGTEAPVSG